MTFRGQVLKSCGWVMLALILSPLCTTALPSALHAVLLSCSCWMTCQVWPLARPLHCPHLSLYLNLRACHAGVMHVERVHTPNSSCHHRISLTHTFAMQVWVGVVPVGPKGHTLNSSYQTRNSNDYKEDLGNAIVNCSRVVPDGLLVFFASYGVMKSCIDHWKAASTGGPGEQQSSAAPLRLCRTALTLCTVQQA